MPADTLEVPRWVVAGLFRAAEFKEQQEGAPLWDDECRRSIEWMRTNIAPNAGTLLATGPKTP